MKITKHLTILIISLAMVSCSDDTDPINTLPVTAETVTNLFAPQQGGQGQPISGPFTYFDFASGQVTNSPTEWDIAFRGTTIIVNGGSSLGTIDEPERSGNAAAYIATGTFDAVNTVNEGNFVQDSDAGYAIPSGSGNGWYLYDPQAMLVSPIAGKVLVFKTRDGKYAKMEILSYYKDAPENPDAFTDEIRYYTFNYAYQPNEGETSF